MIYEVACFNNQFGTNFKSFSDVLKKVYAEVTKREKTVLAGLHEQKLLAPQFHAFSGAHIQTITLGNQDMAQLPAEIRNLPELTVLQIDKSQITTLPDWIAEFNHLVE